MESTEAIVADGWQENHSGPVIPAFNPTRFRHAGSDLLSEGDIREIQQVQAMYGHAVDWPDQSLLRFVFSQDAVFDGTPCGSECFRGLPAICEFFELGKPPHPKSHQMTNCWIYEQDGHVFARAKWHVLSQHGRVLCVGDYDDTLVRTAEGWRIGYRVVTPRDPEGGMSEEAVREVAVGCAT